ncbi:hypothetical protein SAMD00023353_1000800 [Rosellinia necatrix]|uniref:Uncharacterized protein n=1 Tax=Rosellinia necatrix TaxID=77044 RepID=A0A1W2TBW1_ROSNE|nr:hypothetical protein SAMD00023353_1000800 [Rosellinia necatrix]
MRTVFLRHEGCIARNIALGIIDDGNPASVKLAFMAAEAHLINRQSPQAVDLFCDTFVHHKPWPSSLYRIRALSTLQQIHDALVEYVKWDWAGAELPLVDTSREMSPTEAARQRRYGYILEAGYTLFQLLPPAPPPPISAKTRS